MTATYGDVLEAAAMPPDEHGRLSIVATTADSRSILDLAAALCRDTAVLVCAASASGEIPEPVRAAIRKRGWDTGSDLSSSSNCDTLTAETLILASGGSTGTRRLIVNTAIRRGAMRPIAARVSSRLGWRAGQRQLVIGPLDHAAPLTFFVEGLADGNELHVVPEFAAGPVLDLIERERIEWLATNPLHLQRLAAEQVRHPRDLSSVTALVHASAACPPATKTFWHNQLGSERVYEMYGNSESIGIAAARGTEWQQRPGTVGRGFFTRFEIRDPDGFRLPPGQTGDIYVVRPPGHAVPSIDADRLTHIGPGLTGVGDRGWLDRDGYLFLAPRQLAAVTVGGETVLPTEVETVFLQHDDVIDAGACGIDDPRVGQRIAVAIVSAAGTVLDAEGFRRWARSRLTPAARPRHVVVVEQLPRTSAGKIDRTELRALVTTAVERVTG